MEKLKKGMIEAKKDTAKTVKIVKGASSVKNSMCCSSCGIIS